MLFRPDEEAWSDPRVLQYDGAFWLYYAIEEGGVGAALGLARSEDGVHWVDHGRVMERAEGERALGVGGAFRAPTYEQDRRFFLALSERVTTGPVPAAPEIHFAESDNLADWRRMGVEYVFRPDPRWYRAEGSGARWHDLCCLPRVSGGRYGYWTADPLGGEAGFGFGESLDCCHWRALPPPEIVWGNYPAPHALRMGGVVHSVGRYHVLAEGEHTMRGQRVAYHLVAQRPGGPFAPAPRNVQVLATTAPGDAGLALRIVEADDVVLASHLATTCHGERWLAPLKRLQVAADGAAWLTYWDGNDRLIGAPLPVALEAGGQGRAGMSVSLLALEFDAATGLVLEGRWEGLPLQDADLFRGAGFYVETSPGEGTGLLVPMRGQALAGPMSAAGEGFALEDSVDRGLEAKEAGTFRLLLRGELAELYVDDILMDSIALRGPATGKLGIVTAGRSAVRDLVAHRMEL